MDTSEIRKKEIELLQEWKKVIEYSKKITTQLFTVWDCNRQIAAIDKRLKELNTNQK